jgi:hypothetical protein
MGATYKFRDGREIKNTFGDSAVYIDNPYAMCDVTLLRRLKCFPMKNIAAAFCDQWGISYKRLAKIHTKFQYTWVIDLGANRFVPVNAEGYVMAKAFGKTFVGVVHD